LLEALGSKHTCIVTIVRGTGLSRFDGADLDAFVADMKAVADASKLDKFPIFAASQAVPVATASQNNIRNVSAGWCCMAAITGAHCAPNRPMTGRNIVLDPSIKAGWGKAHVRSKRIFITSFSTFDGCDVQL
jgi:hypothetical protein